jgi:hypothetical protein
MKLSKSTVVYLVSLSAWGVKDAAAFSSALFQEAPSLQLRTPSQTEGVDIELPNFDELFERVQRVSALANLVINHGGDVGGARGFAAIEDGGECQSIL